MKADELGSRGLALAVLGNGLKWHEADRLAVPPASAMQWHSTECLGDSGIIKP